MPEKFIWGPVREKNAAGGGISFLCHPYVTFFGHTFLQLAANSGNNKNVCSIKYLRGGSEKKGRPRPTFFSLTGPQGILKSIHFCYCQSFLADKW